MIVPDIPELRPETGLEDLTPREFYELTGLVGLTSLVLTLFALWLLF